MSMVSGVTFICSLSEDEDKVLLHLNESLKKHHCDCDFRELAEHYGGNKHPQCLTLGAGINYLPEFDFAKYVLCHYAWESPERVILVIQPEDGPTRVYRPFMEPSSGVVR
jgi:hypothetical protein